MIALIRCSAIVPILFLAVPVDEPGKKSDATPTSDAKAGEPKTDKKPAAPLPPQYSKAGSIVGKVSSMEDNTIAIDVRVRAARGYRNERVEYTLAEDIKYRTLLLPERSDDKDKRVPLSSQDKAKLRGPDPKLPGYTAEASAVKKGQMVELVLGHLKSPGVPVKRKSDEMPVVTMLTILSEDPRANEKKK